MCPGCGCGELNEDQGDQRHLTFDPVTSAVRAAEISVDEAMKNVVDGLRQAQPVPGKTGSGPAAND